MNKNVIATIRADDLRNCLGISRSTYYRMIKSGRLPEPQAVSDKIRIFNIYEVERSLGFSLTNLDEK